MLNAELLLRLEAKPRKETDVASFFHLARQSQYDVAFYGIHLSNSGRNIIFSEGIPLRKWRDSCASSVRRNDSSQHNQDPSEADTEAFKLKVSSVKL